MIRVLVIDDSLFMRSLISDMLNSDPGIKVIDTAKSGEEAVKKLSKVKPDCITLDLVMPGWDGLTTLEHIMKRQPTPVVVLSAHSKEGADVTVKCLNAGAVGFVLKPSGEVSLDIEVVKHRLLEEVKAASQVCHSSLVARCSKKPKYEPRAPNREPRVVVIGASTGGPQALEKILCSLPANIGVPIVVVQHVPSLFFTESLAEHLKKICGLEVKVAEDEETLLAGTVYFAPAGFETRIIAEKDAKIRVSNPRKSALLSPSIDVTMQSAARVFKANAVGVILSGMGRDGLEGMKAIKAHGGRTLVQDESSLIFGMPKEIIDAHVADKVLPAELMSSELTWKN